MLGYCMASQAGPVERLQKLIRMRHYRIGLHAVRHMIEEGFDENQLLEAVKGKLRIVEEYTQESRYLVLSEFGHFPVFDERESVRLARQMRTLRGQLGQHPIFDVRLFPLHADDHLASAYTMRSV